MRTLISVLYLAIMGGSLQGQVSTKPIIQAGKVLEEVTLDGDLLEGYWKNSAFIEELTMLEPTEGIVASQKTIIQVVTDAKSIIIGVYCYDDPNEIISFSRNRDAELRFEDHIKIVIDPFQNGRTGYVFAVNPGGARYDALVADQGESENEDWDAIWEAVSKYQPDGWSVEIRIPIQSLSFNKDLTAWGFNVERRIQRLQETDRWSSPELDYAFTQTSRAGLLDNIPDFDVGLGLNIRPALVTKASVDEPGAETDFTVVPSLEITKRIGTNILSSLTANTDFAETEVDNRQTNLTRFSLFFPEKRTFFLEGADIFEFGLGLGRDIVPFFSRRIGLVDNQEVPIVVGGKVNGRVGDTNFGALTIRTGNEDGIAPSSTMGVIRVKQNIWRESTFGIIATTGDPLGLSNSGMIGGDFTFQTSRFNGNKNFLAGFWGLASGKKQEEGDNVAFGFKVDYPNDLWDVSLTYKRIGEGFDPSLGFVPRRNVQLIRVGATYAPRPGSRHIRQMRNQLFLTMATGLDFKWQSYRLFTAPINWRLESGDRIEINIVPEGERIPEPFEIADGVIIPEGEYNWIRYRLETEIAAKRQVSGQLSWWFGGFYGGHLHQLEANVIWKPSEMTSFEVEGQRNIGSLPFGDFTQDLISGRLRVNFTTNLQLNTLVQYDNNSKSLGNNTRIRWIFHPLGDLFIVYNHNIRDIENRWIKESNQFILKMQYTFRS
jgi:hypothetical protein